MAAPDPEVEKAATDLVKIREDAERKRTRRLTTIGAAIIIVVLLMQGATLYFSYENREEAQKDRARIAKINRDTRDAVDANRRVMSAAARRTTLGHRGILRALIQLARQADLDVSELQEELDLIDGGGDGSTGGESRGSENGSREEPPERPSDENGNGSRRPKRPPRDEFCVDPPPPLPMVCIRPIP